MDTGEDEKMKISTDDVQVVELSKCCQAPVWAGDGGDYHACECCGEHVEPQANELWELLSHLCTIGISWRNITSSNLIRHFNKPPTGVRVFRKDRKMIDVKVTYDGRV